MHYISSSIHSNSKTSQSFPITLQEKSLRRCGWVLCCDERKRFTWARRKSGRNKEEGSENPGQQYDTFEICIYNNATSFLYTSSCYCYLQPTCRRLTLLSKMVLLIALAKCVPEMQLTRPHRLRQRKLPKSNRQGTSFHYNCMVDPFNIDQQSIIFFTGLQVKQKLKTFMESMLTKAGKIRGLVRDLKQNYSESTAMAT